MGIRSYQEIKNCHPCFGGYKNNAGRIHLPVSPGCNIACRFCDRSLNDVEQRPGVASRILTPEDAETLLEKALLICPDIRVAGIAGPGDTLASDRALETFRMVGEKFPQLLKCMSTTGLLLAERAEEVVAVGIDTLTVTVNAVDPAIEAQLNDYILYPGKKIEGEEGARILIHNQLEGIKKVAAAGVTVKVNSVLVPEINGDHIETIAKTVKEAGARLYNVIPLIPQHKLKDCHAPTCAEIGKARFAASKYIEVFTHCQRCRADAVGVPGKSEFGGQLYQDAPRVRETFSHG